MDKAKRGNIDVGVPSTRPTHIDLTRIGPHPGRPSRLSRVGSDVDPVLHSIL